MCLLLKIFIVYSILSTSSEKGGYTLGKTKLTGRIVTPGDSEYEQARINNNLSFPKFPKIIVFCQNTKDVQNALKWARENHIPFQVRSGRHSYENF